MVLAETCVEALAGKNPTTVDYGNIPGCTYCQPHVASVGLTEEKARELGHEVKIGKFPFTASGKAVAAGKAQGFVKISARKDHTIETPSLGATGGNGGGGTLP